jgi:hypothetical protein
MRDTAKFVGVIAFIYALYAPSGLAWLGSELKKIWHFLGGRRQVAGAFVAMYAIMLMGGFWGVSNTLHAYWYPNGWAEAETYLQVKSVKKVVILPWRGYLTLHFAGDEFAANPARLYFSTEVLQGQGVNNAFLDLKRPKTEYDIIAEEIVTGNVDTALASYGQKGVDLVVLLKTADWHTYYQSFEQLDPVYENADIVMYDLTGSGEEK